MVIMVGEPAVPVFFHVCEVSCPRVFIILKFYLHLTYVYVIISYVIHVC